MIELILIFFILAVITTISIGTAVYALYLLGFIPNFWKSKS
jgi:hypothetical protein